MAAKNAGGKLPAATEGARPRPVGKYQPAPDKVKIFRVWRFGRNEYVWVAMQLGNFRLNIQPPFGTWREAYDWGRKHAK